MEIKKDETLLVNNKSLNELVNNDLEDLNNRVEAFYDWLVEQRDDLEGNWSSAERYGIAQCYYKYREIVLNIND